ncbi:MAG TPA: hypothetical protein VG826_36215 [Pirellulales bacterium]|nr:hypothetical protein [Pirellulales bacterium]
MLDQQRFKLRFGPYRTPKFKYGARVMDEIRGEVEIVGLHDGPIPWPVGKRGHVRALILYGDLVKAVRHEANIVVQHWFGVKHATVRKWRRALSVAPTNAGTSQLRREHFDEPWGHQARNLAVCKARDPARREKIGASRRGKPRPPHVIAAMREGRTGKPHSDEAKAKIRAAHRKRGTRPPKAGRPWTAEEDALCRTLRPAEMVRRTDRTLSAVNQRRRALGLRDGRRRETKAIAPG